MTSRGFTLIELMIVVAIVGVLAVVAVGSFKRAGSRARSAEVYGMFGELRTKEEAYRAEFSQYCNTQTTCPTAANENVFYPALVAVGEPVAKLISNAAWPTSWSTLGLNPGKSSLYCGYVVVAGLGSGSPSNPLFNGGARGTALYSAGLPTGPYWYANATCDMDGNTAVNTIYVTGKDTTNVVVTFEGN